LGALAMLNLQSGDRKRFNCCEAVCVCQSIRDAVQLLAVIHKDIGITSYSCRACHHTDETAASQFVSRIFMRLIEAGIALQTDSHFVCPTACAAKCNSAN